MIYFADNQHVINSLLFYQDFKDTFVCNTQLASLTPRLTYCCFIRISKILLYAIHNCKNRRLLQPTVVLSGFQRYFCMQYTTLLEISGEVHALFYQDFKDTFVCNTQLDGFVLKPGEVVLSGFQRYFCMQYTTYVINIKQLLFYQDFKDTFVCNTQRVPVVEYYTRVVLSGFQRYFCMQYTTHCCYGNYAYQLFYQDFKDTFVCNTQRSLFSPYVCMGCFIRISKILLYAIHNIHLTAN